MGAWAMLDSLLWDCLSPLPFSIGVLLPFLCCVSHCHHVSAPASHCLPATWNKGLGSHSPALPSTDSLLLSCLLPALWILIWNFLPVWEVISTRFLFSLEGLSGIICSGNFTGGACTHSFCSLWSSSIGLSAAASLLFLFSACILLSLVRLGACSHLSLCSHLCTTFFLLHTPPFATHLVHTALSLSLWVLSPAWNSGFYLFTASLLSHLLCILPATCSRFLHCLCSLCTARFLPAWMGFASLSCYSLVLRFLSLEGFSLLVHFYSHCTTGYILVSHSLYSLLLPHSLWSAGSYHTCLSGGMHNHVSIDFILPHYSLVSHTLSPLCLPAWVFSYHSLCYFPFLSSPGWDFSIDSLFLES